MSRLLEAFLDHLKVERGVAPNTVAAYRRDLTLYLAELASRRIDDPARVTEAHVSEFLAGLRVHEYRPGRPYSAATVARVLSAVRGFHRYLLREGTARSNPAEPIGSPRTPRALPKALSEIEVERLLSAVSDGGPANLRDRAILETLYASGLRISELTALDVGDVDVHRRLVRCVGKANRERVVPLGRAAVEALRAYLARARPTLVRGRPETAMFLNTRGRRLTRQGCWKLLKKYAQRAELKRRISPHTLRHSFATHLLGGGADVRDVQELLGHASVTHLNRSVGHEKLRAVYESAHPRAKRPSGAK